MRDLAGPADGPAIQPRPWRVAPSDEVDGALQILQAAGHDGPDIVADGVSPAVAELIVRLVNAEQWVVAALEAAEPALADAVVADGSQPEGELALVRVALAKVRP